MTNPAYPTLESGKELTAILEATLDDILIADGDGYVLQVSPAFAQMYGVATQEILGQNVRDLERRGIFKPSITKQVLDQKQKITMTQENKDGRKIVVSAVPLYNEQGKINRVISFSRDITEMLALQEQYKTLERKVEIYSDKLIALDAADFSTPLFFGKSKKIQNVVDLISKVAKFDVNVLLTGESGSGKTFFAKFMHAVSARKDKEMVEVNCGAIPGTLLESELFGYEKGAFTGANPGGKIGLIELAHGGTLFLDEIGEIPVELQANLLKVIQDKTITRIGATKPIKVDFRLIAATNRNLEELVFRREFRRDLYYRLNVISVEIPSLRDTKEDVFGLTMQFLEKFNRKYGLNKRLAGETLDILQNYSWPGNIRELENLIERMVLISSGDLITIEDIPESVKSTQSDFTQYSGHLKTSLASVEKKMVLDAYAKTGTTTGAAKELGISQPSAVRKIQKYKSRSD